ncbi:hypothetical protein [Phenylobacterium sp.]|uniref:hypothetical protein n=1 Tax=Phenylobacterium sp. TaxID=1871053 RepID=UPI002DE70502|nr:hypothetical protein [Phenylobacterium sp.]
MTPEVPAVLAQLAQVAARNAAPGVPDAERASDLAITAMLLTLAAEVWDGAAARLVEENRALRALLGQAGGDDDLRLSALTAENHGLRAKLIEAHIAAEQSDDAARQDLIWAELLASTERRKLSVSLV